jgi:G3E family GTPase
MSSSENLLAAPAPSHLPVAVISGAPGAGKTTVLNHLLSQPTLRAAVLVSTGAGASPTKAVPHGPGLASLQYTEEKVIRLALGSNCQQIRGDVLLAAGFLVRDAAWYDCLLLENASQAAVAPVARTFAPSLHYPAYGLTLSRHARLASLVTVIDASRFVADLQVSAGAALAATVAGSDSMAADVLVEQVEQATVLLLTKSDLVAPEALAWLQRLLRQLNPTAQLLTATHGVVAATDLLPPTGPAGVAPPVAADLRPDNGAFLFRDERPFHPERLWQFVRKAWPVAVLRSQGLFWLASRPEDVLSWSQAEPSRRMAPVGTWWAAVPDRDRDPAYQLDAPALRARWHPHFQDRLTTLRFSGPDLDAAQLRASLEACLCTPLEISRWRRGHLFADPWPRT